ncbi:hypothetical protein [Vulcanisaeta distributa]|uniref:Uncharacterized protein n=1 Tax=Vulcanisaeta distributa (strain DSM 14429 / JCM 11212 / NBRC 100878 / IC-017) TaxID=572478 RepID=E1QSD3_VULDI|nr:hypothetical protein [Vulcanisaeta distributa]ADN49526.1 hypothetical protein Vdis_0113 [Vulcanisaeta distributa DSM 14429]
MAISKGDLALCADELRSMGFDAGRLTISVRDYVLSRVCQLIRDGKTRVDDWVNNELRRYGVPFINVRFEDLGRYVRVFVDLASIEELAYEGPLRCDPKDINGLPYRVALVMCELVKEHLRNYLGMT